MGGGGSTSISQELNMSVVNDILYKSVTNNENYTENDMQNVQKLNIKIGKLIGCDLTTEQEITSSFMATMQQITESFQMVQNDIISELQAQAGAALDKQTQMGNLQFGDKTNLEQKINTEIKTMVETQLETNNLQTTINKSINIQEQDVFINEAVCIDGNKLEFKQNISADLAAQAVAKNLLSAATSNKVANEIVTDIDASLKTKAGGAAEVVDSVGSAAAGVLGAMTGPARYAIIASVICCCMAVIAMIVLGMSPAGQKGLNKSVNAGLAKFGR